MRDLLQCSRGLNQIIDSAKKIPNEKLFTVSSKILKNIEANTGDAVLLIVENYGARILTQSLVCFNAITEEYFDEFSLKRK